MKKLLIGLGVLVVVAAVGVFVFLGSLNDIVKTAVEKVGSDLSQTDVRLSDVDIELTSGKGTLRGFAVTNPKGFSEGDAFRFDEVNVQLDLASVQDDPVVIREIVIDGPVVVYELAGDGGSNLETINSRLRSRSGGSGTASGGSGRTPNIVIENLYLRNGSVALRAPLLDKPVTMPLPPIHLTDIGRNGKGATPGEVANQVMASILAGARDAVARANVDVGRLIGEARKAVEGAASGAGDLGREAGDSMKGLIEGLGTR